MAETGPRRRQVQDDIRERQLADQLQLERSPSRTGSDAKDEFGNRYELKTVTTNSVTTGRDVGLPYLARLRDSFLVCARGVNTDYGFRTESIYFLSPDMMEDWITNLETKILADAALVDTAVEALEATGFEGDVQRLRYLASRGFTVNNPKISWAYIVGHGVRIEGEPALHLRELVRLHPIVRPAP